MTSAWVRLVFLPCLCISGWPVVMFDFGCVADWALRASVAEVNERSLTLNLYRATNQAVNQIMQVGFNTYDFTFNFGIKMTVCLRHHSGSPDKCPFSLRPSVHLCSSHVRVSGREVLSLLEVSCGPRAVSSSSVSSSEEMILQGVPQNRRRVYKPGGLICQGA